MSIIILLIILGLFHQQIDPIKYTLSNHLNNNLLLNHLLSELNHLLFDHKIPKGLLCSNLHNHKSTIPRSSLQSSISNQLLLTYSNTHYQLGSHFTPICLATHPLAIVDLIASSIDFVIIIATIIDYIVASSTLIVSNIAITISNIAITISSLAITISSLTITISSLTITISSLTITISKVECQRSKQ